MENGVVNLSNGLGRDAFQTEIVCLERVGEFARRLRRDVEVCCLNKPDGASVRAILTLANWIRKSRPDVIHTHNLGPLLYAILARFCAFSRVPILHGEHGMFRTEERGRKYRIMRQLLYRGCRRIHSVSVSLRAYICELGFPTGNMIAVLNGVDCNRFRPSDDKDRVRREIGLPPEGPVIGMVGRLVETKRHLLMLKAFEEIALQNQGACLLIVGDGGDFRNAVLGAIEKHPNRERIFRVGHQDDPLSYYQSMDLLAMPSDAEGLSNALLEAMACGVPAVASPSCGAGEVIESGTNGVLRNMGSADDLAEVVLETLEDPKNLTSLGKQARETAEESFSLEFMVERYANLYREVVGGGSSTR